MAKINILGKEVFNRIAAGEVVENPRSIVKELVENGIDANAKNISIFIEDGGMQSIVIIDDGSGIPKSEVKKAFLPHATSKISTAEDIETIGTLGFRGEALASIASVSEVTLRTLFSGENIGTKYTLKGGVEIEFTDCALEKGTNISVSSLFFNTPARLKFLKSQRSEEANVTSTVQNLILANPNVAFRYSVDGELKFISSGEGLESTVKSVYPLIFESLAPIAAHSDGYRLSGYISVPNYTKGNRSGQTLILNGRVVNDLSLSATVQNAYGERLMTRCFPFYILDIIMPFDLVDVNVHPNKSEVRLQNPRLLYSFVYRAVQEALLNLQKKQVSDFMAMSMALKEEKTESFSPILDAKIEVVKSCSPKPQLTTAPIEIEKQFSFEEVYESVTGKSTDTFAFHSSKQAKNIPINVSYPVQTHSNPNDTNDNSTGQGGAFSENSEYSSPKNNNNAEMHIGNIKIVGQIFQNYLIVERGSQGYIIDQHAAHERTIFDKLIKATESETVLQQPLLIPFVFTGTVQECEFILSNRSALQEIGFDCEEFGSNAIKVNAVPLAVSSLKFDEFFRELLSEMSGIRGLKTSDLIKKRLAQIACKSAIKAGDELSSAQIHYFISVFIDGGAPIFCPHGRPTVVPFDKLELEKRFKRKL